MLSNSLINAIMNQGNSSVQSRKRFSKNSLILSHDNNCKLKPLPSSTCISNPTTADPKTNLSEDSKIMLDYGKSTYVNKTVAVAVVVFGIIYSLLRNVIKEWETKYKSQELLRKKEQRSQAKNSKYFYQRCLTLEHKISEMEKFLADYGLIWVGDVKNTTNVDSSNNYINTCYEQLVTNIDQLNLAAGKGEVHIHHNEKGGGATFKTPSCMALKFYKNGMCVNGGPLRSYYDPTAVSFIRDILDGYFPSELQQEYPDGVPFMIEDHRTELHIDDSASFPGQGYRLGKQSPMDNLLSTNLRRSNSIYQRYARANPSPKDSTSEYIPLLSLPSRLDPRTSSESPSVDIYSLRSQILASHNNVCSSSHIQSHVNAELARNSRREKRELATKNVEYDMSMSEQLSRSKDTLRSTSSSRTRHRSFSDRSSSRSQIVDSRLRSKSASSSAGRLGIATQSTLRSKALSTAEVNNIDELKIANLVSECFATKHPRGSRSATCARKSLPPILRQINEATGKPNELRLKVRSLTGSTIYLVHLLADESVTKLYELLDKAMQTSGYRGYKVVLSGYSPKRLQRISTSLKESGINRDCVLHLVND
ncbi:UBX domain-containing protein 11 [Trachymyrmex zeteki]|uniref:UBX domain-containing protein 11 n=1 Tax=Mycetomoellerius zeteki TaxID=64791 RepID=A0A151X921_9HYME|nr:UBX domain-containing protein 11 [Trachymyrmex zeteki]